jgi:hypothetical protein
VPLFIEELAKSLLESGNPARGESDHFVPTGAPPALAILTTLHDLRWRGSDRLGPANETAQLGAVMGPGVFTNCSPRSPAGPGK